MKIKPWVDDQSAPNGRSIKENFQNWFENSSVVKNNEPEIVYHVANNNFDTFDRAKIGSAYGLAYKLKGIVPLGFYFSNKIQGQGCHNNEIEVAPGRTGDAPIVLPVYLSLKNH